MAPLPDERRHPPAGEPEAASRDSTLDGSLPAYLAYAFEHSPALRASFEEWRSTTERPQQARKLPEPTVTYAGFIRSVETRVGPQRHKLGLMQWFPWPTKLTAGGEAEALRARAAQRRFEAHALEITAAVSRAYWKLWFIGRNREVFRDLNAILQNLSAQVRIRVVASRADLADLAQVDLRVSRLDDALAGLDETERAAAAELTRVLGAPDGTGAPVVEMEPDVGLPAEARGSLVKAAVEHPRVEAIDLVSQSHVERGRRARADRFPSLGLGVDWIITGDAADPSSPDSGKDAVVAMAAVRVPLWQGKYAAAEREASAQSRAYQARQRAAKDAATADVDKILASIREQARRVELYETTLIPQAETVFASVQGSYQAGRSAIADILLAERDLLELELDRYRAQRDFAIAWAELERVVGRPVVMIEKAPSHD